MSKKYLIGVDLGTSATKAALYSSDGVLVAEASAEVALYYPKPGVVEQKNEDFYLSAVQTIRQCLLESGIDAHDVAAIAFASQMAGIGSVDEHFHPAAPFDSWMDMRCEPYIKAIDQQYGDLITRTTGCPPTCNHGPKILWCKEETPQAYERTVSFVVPAGYVAGTMAGLSGDQAFIDYTFIHFSALCDARAGAWSVDLCDKLGVDAQKLPRIVAPWEIIGAVTERAAKETGLAPGTPIAAGAGDTAAGALGAGIVQPGMLLDVAGTAAVLAGCASQFAADHQHRALIIMRSVIPGLWNPLAYIAGGGLALRWFRDQFYNAPRGQTQPLSADADLYDEMSRAAAAVAPGADGLFFSPHLGGRICPADPAMRGAWIGFSWGHTQAHFFRAILESVAYEYAYYLGILCQIIPDLALTEARVIGGGARGDTWSQIKADVLGVPYQRLSRSEFSTWGCALIAGHAVGIFGDLVEAAQRTTAPRGEALPPHTEHTQTYSKLVEQYIRWQSALSETFDHP
ncbi:MAG: xylulose kinase [Anaerolineae bacterium]|nr:xylulose kinase [Anaerolineae bacterium]